MKKFYYLALISLLGWSCQKDQEQLTPVDPVPEVEDIALAESSLSLNQALNNLNFVYRNFEGKAQVAKRIRKVDVITRGELTDPLTRALTRSEGDEDLPLLYVVNYENDEGFALLGADMQVPPIISIGDEGNFSTQEYLDFVNSGTEEVFTDSDSDANVQNLQFALVSNALEPRLIVFPPVTPGVTFPIYEYSDTAVLVKCWPLLRTKWEQGNPYNFYCTEEIDGEEVQYVAGCVPVAVAQVVASLAYHQNFRQPSYKVEEDGMEYYLPLETIAKAITDTMKYAPYQYTNGSLAIAESIKAIGVAVDANYGTQSTSAFGQKVFDFLESLGINAEGASTRTLSPLTEEIAFNMIVNKNLPLYTQASRIKEDGSPTGHAFVLDGWLRLEYSQSGGSVFIETSRFCFNLAHVNFGYGGNYDGYYLLDGFDMTATEFDDYVEEGDNPKPSLNRNYNLSIRCIPFNL